MEKEDLIFKTKPELFSISQIIISNKTISLLNVKESKIRINEESELEKGTLDQRVIKVVPSTTKLYDFYVRLEISLEDKVYLETYYHHTQDDIQVHETPTKI